MDSAGQDDIRHAPRISLSGLGIAGVDVDDEEATARRVSLQRIQRSSVLDVRDVSERDTPGSTAAADPLISPMSTGNFSSRTRFDSPGEIDTAYNGGSAHHMSKQSMGSLHSNLQPSIYAKSDAGLLSIRSRYDDWEPDQNCRTHKSIKQLKGSWISTIILTLSLFSTILSGIFLVIALRSPAYGRLIHTNGPLTISLAAFLTSFLAKLVELSFVTVLVAFLGQALARRAFTHERARGVTLAELNMRSWVTQPGTMFTQWQSVRYAGITTLGMLSLLGAVCAMLYTPSATALVQPQLQFVPWTRMHLMQGLVKTEFANTDYVSSTCQYPISSETDPQAPQTCIQLEHAANGFHNFFQYLDGWTALVDNGSATPQYIDLAVRPKGFAILNDNTTVTAPWIERDYTNMTASWEQQGIIVNNVSMAVPHPGVVQAAIDPINKIMQPVELDSLGVYNIKASVPSPVVHVLCATMTEQNLQPFIYSSWPDVETVDGTVDMTKWPAQLQNYAAYQENPFLNKTPYHDIFEWGAEYSETAWPPIFGKLALPYNTIVNDTTNLIAYGRDSLYLLAAGGSSTGTAAVTTDVSNGDYALCQIKVSQTPYCSTRYNASSTGGTLEAVCEDPDDEYQYIRSLPDATSGKAQVSADWPNIGSEWAMSLSLNQGKFDGNATNARLLSQLIITNNTNDPSAPPSLNPALPSIAEALAVMSGCTLLQSAADAPFVEFWDYSGPYVITGQYQRFNASIRAQQYASGSTQPYQNAFYLILFGVFLINAIVLVYFVMHREWYNDFCEPTNLFSLAVNSPPSKELAGSCGGGPAGEQYRVSWKLNTAGEHVYMESQGLEVEEMGERRRPGLRRRTFGQGLGLLMTPVRKAGSTFDVEGGAV